MTIGHVCTHGTDATWIAEHLRKHRDISRILAAAMDIRDKSGNLGGQATGPPGPIHLFGNVRVLNAHVHVLYNEDAARPV
ncbi:hypothetical protein TNCV_1235031 [Trichonephila clavipes]|nr:hypothetical protein TNCV_1235031 [Trichonephila clavipes]